MASGDETSEVTPPRTRPPALDDVHPSSIVLATFDRPVPLPLPPRAFAPYSPPQDFRLADAPPPADDIPSVEPALSEHFPQADDPFSAVSAEASVRSAKAFIEDLSRSAPASVLAPVFEERQEPSFDPPALSASAVDLGLRPDAPAPIAAQDAKFSYGHVAWRVAKIAGMAAACWLALVLVLIAAYRFVNPPISALMLQKLLVGGAVAHQWVPIENMSPNIVRAVLLSEDGRFCEHNGVDYEALQQAVEQAANGGSRGASTISMQVVKNLFLWPSKSYLRKALEFPLTYVMEFIWPKRRIMEVYLNIAEWGPGIFGVQQAAEYHFNKTAWGLTAQEAARLAVALPNPIARDAGDPGYGTQRLAGAVQVRMRLAPSSQLACVLPKRRI